MGASGDMRLCNSGAFHHYYISKKGRPHISNNMGPIYVGRMSIYLPCFENTKFKFVPWQN